MLYFDGTDFSEGIDIKKTSKSKVYNKDKNNYFYNTFLEKASNELP